MLAGRMEDYGACAVELNLSCPHAQGYGMELGTDPKVVVGIVSAVSDAVSVPVWVKLTPNTHILTQIASAAESAGADAIVAINTLKAMVIVPEFAKPAVSIPIVGVGGIEDHRDALEYIMAGASAFQVGTGVLTRGPEVFADINAGLESFMEEYGYPDIRSMVGVAND